MSCIGEALMGGPCERARLEASRVRLSSLPASVEAVSGQKTAKRHLTGHKMRSLSLGSASWQHNSPILAEMREARRCMSR